MRKYKYNTALLIDDSYIDNLINRKILENNFFAENVLIMSSGRQAIEYMQKCIDSNTALPEVLFLDIRMPEMNGFDFLKEMNAIDGLNPDDVKIYLLSSSLDPDDFKKTENLKSVSKFIGKPLTIQILKAI